MTAPPGRITIASSSNTVIYPINEESVFAAAIPNFCEFSTDEDLMCTSERGGLVKVWKRIERNPGTYSVPVSNSFAEVSPDGKYFAAVGLSQRSSRLPSLTVFEVETGEQVFRRRFGFGRITPSKRGDSSDRGLTQRLSSLPTQRSTQ
jgi:hypothetical protein